MLNREEYNFTFNTDLTPEDFEKLIPIDVNPDNIDQFESLAFIHPQTKVVTEFIQIVRCRNCKWWNKSNTNCPKKGGYWKPDEFCSDGERKDGESDGET